jgi:Ca2+-transporting ATPase
VTTTLPKATAERYHTLSIAEVLAVERVERDDGLSSVEVAARRAAFGPNRFAEARREPRWRAFARQYADPMQIVLLCAGLGSLYPLKQLGTGLLLLALTLFNAVLGLRQEGKAAAADDGRQGAGPPRRAAHGGAGRGPRPR